VMKSEFPTFLLSTFVWSVCGWIETHGEGGISINVVSLPATGIKAKERTPTLSIRGGSRRYRFIYRTETESRSISFFYSHQSAIAQERSFIETTGSHWTINFHDECFSP
jgi:hypothetical protein